MKGEKAADSGGVPIGFWQTTELTTRCAEAGTPWASVIDFSYHWPMSSLKLRLLVKLHHIPRPTITLSGPGVLTLE